MMKQKLGLVFPSEVVDKFFGFLKDTIEFSAKKEEVDEEKKLDPTIYEVNDASHIRISYEPVRRWQQVIHVGVLTNDKKSSILGKVPQPIATAPQAEKDKYNSFVELINIIAAESQQQLKEFFDKYFEGFLTYDDLYGPASLGLSEQAKKHKLFATITPFVKQKLVRQYVVQTLAINLSSDPTLVEQLLTNKNLLTDPDIINNPGKPLLDAFAALEYRGTNAKFFDNTGTQLGQPLLIVKTVDTSLAN